VIGWMEQANRDGWTNEAWVQALRRDGPHASSAEAELHRMLRDGLRRAFSARPAVLEWVDDFAQEASIRVLQQLPTFRGDSRFSTWALAIAVRIAFDELRRKRWHDVSLDALVGTGDHPASRYKEDPEKVMGRRDMLRMLQKAMSEHLTPKQLLALSAELKGMPQSEIGRRIGANRNAIYKLTHDGRKKLKHVLSQQGITAEAIAWAFSADARGLL